MKRRKKKNIMGQKISASRIQAKQVNQGGEVSQNETMEFLKQNTWNVLGTGAAILPTVAQAIILFISYRYSQGWGEYYGIDKKYFDGAVSGQNQWGIFIGIIMTAVYFWLFPYLSQGLNKKLDKIWTFAGMVLLIFLQNITYTQLIINKIPWSERISMAVDWIIFLLLLINAIILGCFFILREPSIKERPLKRLEKIVYSTMIGIYLSYTAFGVFVCMDNDISGKRTYEVCLRIL